MIITAKINIADNKKHVKDLNFSLGEAFSWTEEENVRMYVGGGILIDLHMLSSCFGILFEAELLVRFK